jgi:osmotically-inducible protein OsmY
VEDTTGEYMAASAQKVRDRIDAALKASSKIKEGNYVTVKTEKAGLFGKTHIALTGRTISESMKATIGEIAESAAEGLAVENQLRVSTTS